MRPRSLLALAGCGALFGLSFVLVRLQVGALGPVTTTAARTLLGGATLAAVAAARGQAPQARRWPRYLALGLVSAAVPFSLISVATARLNAGTAAVLNTSSVLFALAFEAARCRRWPDHRKLAGLVIAVAGVVAVMSARGVRIGGSLGAIAAGLAGAAVFAYGGFYAARHFAATPPLAVATGQQLAAGVLLLPAVTAQPPHGPVSARLVAVVALLGLLGGGLAYLLFYWLIEHEGPARTATVNLLVPLFGVLWGRVLLDEPMPGTAVAGMTVAVGGLAMILWPGPPAH